MSVPRGAKAAVNSRHINGLVRKQHPVASNANSVTAVTNCAKQIATAAQAAGHLLANPIALIRHAEPTVAEAHVAPALLAKAVMQPANASPIAHQTAQVKPVGLTVVEVRVARATRAQSVIHREFVSSHHAYPNVKAKSVAMTVVEAPAALALPVKLAISKAPASTQYVHRTVKTSNVVMMDAEVHVASAVNRPPARMAFALTYLKPTVVQFLSTVCV